MYQLKSFGTEYIERIQKIWKLNEPPLHRKVSEKGFYRAFRLQYEQARMLSAENSSFTRYVILPLIEKEELLTEIEETHLYQVCTNLIALDNQELMDWILCLKLYERLMKDAKRKKDQHKIIMYTTPLVKLLYHLCDVFRREDTEEAEQVQEDYKEVALSYIDDIRKWLPIDIFSALTEEEQKEILCVNRLESLFWYPKKENLRESIHKRIVAAKGALDLIKNQEYRRRNPDCPWEAEEDACLYYLTVCSSIVYSKDDVYPEDLQILYQACFEQKQGIEEGKYSYSDIFEAEQMTEYMRYLYQEISPTEYIGKISKGYLSRNKQRYDAQGINENVYRPAQILEILVRHLDSVEAIEYMEEIYRDLITYSYGMPNNEYQELFLVYMLIAVNCFQEIEGGIQFADLCSALLSNCSPSTYVHSQMVGKISKVIGEEMVRKRPELFLGLCDLKTVEEVKKNRKEIGNVLYRCGLFHDIGKLPYLDTIGVTYRALFPDELNIIRLHSCAGYCLLKKYPSTRLYAQTAYGHHKWYNDKKGYSEKYSRENAEFPILTDIVSVADCLDAATDIIFRSYNKGITLEDYIEEVKKGAGERYSPDVATAFNSKSVCETLSKLLIKGREEAYLNAYKIKK